MSGSGQLFIVSGPSGAGKSSVVEHLLKKLPDLVFSVSYTTRAPRAGEQEGREYCFVNRETFEEMEVRDEFLEYATVFGDLYGTPRRAVAEAQLGGKDLVLDIDVQGARQVKAKLPDAVAILLLPPSAAELERRLRGRAQDPPEIMQRRLDRARAEIESYNGYDYLVVNREIGETCRTVAAIVTIERHRRNAGPATPEEERRAAAVRRDSSQGLVSAILETFGAKHS